MLPAPHTFTHNSLKTGRATSSRHEFSWTCQNVFRDTRVRHANIESAFFTPTGKGKEGNICEWAVVLRRRSPRMRLNYKNIYELRPTATTQADNWNTIIG